MVKLVQKTVVNDKHTDRIANCKTTVYLTLYKGSTVQNLKQAGIVKQLLLGK